MEGESVSPNPSRMVIFFYNVALVAAWLAGCPVVAVAGGDDGEIPRGMGERLGRVRHGRLKTGWVRTPNR